MSMETKPPAGQAPVPGTDSAFEHEDASPSGLVKSGIFLAILLVIVFVAMRFAWHGFMDFSPAGQNASPMTDARILPPHPRLQTDPQKEIHDYCQQQAEVLDSYAWVDQSAGIVRIPVDRAIELTLKNGLPARADGKIPVDAAEPASGAAGDPQGITGQCGYLHNEIEQKQELTKEVEEEAARAKSEK
jgi:hypothetical protein